MRGKDKFSIFRKIVFLHNPEANPILGIKLCIKAAANLVGGENP